MRSRILAILPMVALASCAAESMKAPVSTAFQGGGPASTEPEAPNSLPLGSAVDAPLTSSAGNLNSTRVGPATLGTARAAPSTASRY